MSTLSLPTSLSTPSLSVPSLSLSLSSPPPPPTSSPSLTDAPSTTPTPTPTSESSSVPSSTTSSSIASTSPPSSTASSTTTASAADTQSSTSFAPTTTSATATIVSNLIPSSSLVVYTSTSLAPSPTATKSSSSAGFFSNTGAVAGTFTIVGLVSIAGVIAVALLIIKRRRSRSYEEDMEYLDKTPDLSADPSTTRITSPDDGFFSDQYNAPPLPLASPPALYYPDHAYALHPQAFSPDTPASHGYAAGYTQDHVPQHIYPPDKYGSPHPPLPPRVDPNMPNPHPYANVKLDSTPAPATQTATPDALRPSVRPTSTAARQWANTRLSVDSFYTGIATDHQSPSGQAF